jgi:hypothetical protein
LAYLVEFGFSTESLLSKKAFRLVRFSAVSATIFGLGMGVWSWRYHEGEYRNASNAPDSKREDMV